MSALLRTSLKGAYFCLPTLNNRLINNGKFFLVQKLSAECVLFVINVKK